MYTLTEIIQHTKDKELIWKRSISFNGYIAWDWDAKRVYKLRVGSWFRGIQVRTNYMDGSDKHDYLPEYDLFRQLLEAIERQGDG